MGMEDTSWLEGLTAFEDDASFDGLLDGLLDDDCDGVEKADCSRACQSQPAWHAVIVAAAPLATEETAACPPPTSSDKRKRTQQKKKNRRGQREGKKPYRTKEELERLRRAVADLENLLALAQQRARTGRLPPVLATEEAAQVDVSREELMWMDIASRQYRYLREAQILNGHLRSQVLIQVQVVNSLMRIVQRARYGLPSQSVPRPLADANVDGFAFKLQETIGVTMEMSDSLDRMFVAPSFRASSDELSASTTCRFKNHVIPSRARLVSGFIRRYVPHSASDVGDYMWEMDRPSEEGKEVFRVQLRYVMCDFCPKHIEETDDRHVMMATVRITDNAEAKCVIVRRLFASTSTRWCIVAAGSLWPSPDNESPWDCVGMDTRHWFEVRDSSTLAHSLPLTEVRYAIEASKLAGAQCAMAPCEATMLLGFVAKAIDFGMTKIHEKLDRMLLY